MLKTIAEETFDHDETVMAGFSTTGQLAFRRQHIETFLNVQLGSHRLVACAGRGGMLKPIPSGAISVNEALVEFALHTPIYHHASNLGAPLAHGIAVR